MKKIILVSVLVFAVLTLSAVSASDNATSDALGVDESYDNTEISLDSSDSNVLTQETADENLKSENSNPPEVLSVASDSDCVSIPSDASSDICAVSATSDAKLVLGVTKDDKLTATKEPVLGKKKATYKTITITAKKYMKTKKSGKYKVKAIIYDMWRPSHGHYKYIDVYLYKNGKMVPNTKYYSKYKIKGRWTGWVRPDVGTSHHRYPAYYKNLNSATVKVKFKV